MKLSGPRVFCVGSFLFFVFFIYFWLRWVFVSGWGLSLVAASEGHSSSWCAGLSLLRPLLLRSTGSRRAGSVVVAHGPNCSAACGILPDQGLNPCPLHWQADSQPLHHQGSPGGFLITDSIPFYLLFVCSDFLFLPDSALIEMYPFLLGYAICWNIIVHSSRLRFYVFLWYQL